MIPMNDNTRTKMIIAVKRIKASVLRLKAYLATLAQVKDEVPTFDLSGHSIRYVGQLSPNTLIIDDMDGNRKKIKLPFDYVLPEGITFSGTLAGNRITLHIISVFNKERLVIAPTSLNDGKHCLMYWDASKTLINVTNHKLHFII